MKKKKLFYGWIISIGCLLITAAMVPPIKALSNKFLIQVTREMNISRSLFTLSNAIVQSLGIFISPIVAKKLAKGNMRKIQSVSVIGYVLSFASYSLAQNIFHLYISSLFLGIFYFNSTLIPVSIMITNWFAEKRGLAMSIAMTGIGFGGFIFSPIITHLLKEYGWRITYVVMALIVLIIALPTSVFILRKKPEDMGLKPYSSENIVNKTVSAGINISVKESKSKFFFYLLLIGMFANGIMDSGSLGQFPPAIEEMHGADIQAIIISLYSIIGVFGKIFAGWLNDRFGIAISAAFVSGMFILAFIFMLNGDNIYALYSMAICYGVGMAIGTVTPPLVTSAIYGSEKYGEAYGFCNSASQVGLSIGSLLIASIYDVFHSYRIGWILLIVLTATAFCSWMGAFIMSKKYRY